MTIACDFDGVIHDNKNPIPGRRMGPPFLDASSAIRKLRHKHTVIIHTVMATNPSGKKAVEDWLTYYGIKHDGVTAIKPRADLYIDDKAIRHIDWTSTLRQIKEL